MADTSEFKSNLADTEKYIKRFKDQTLEHLIAGKSAPSQSGKTFANESPIDNSPLGQVAAGDAADIDLACQAAATAFPEWAAMNGAKRRKLLHAIADGIEARAHEIALVESWDTGQPVRFMSKAAIRGAELSLIHI